MSDEIFLVESGLTRGYFWDTKGNEVSECFGVSGDLFASMFCYFKGEPAFLQYEAVTQMVLYSIRKDDLEELCRQNLAISNLFRTICIEELYCLERKCKIFGKDDALSRVHQPDKGAPANCQGGASQAYSLLSGHHPAIVEPVARFD